MKKRLTPVSFLSLLFVFAVLFTSCNDNNDIDAADLELNGLSDLKLDITFGLSKKTPLKQENISNFLAEKFNEMANMSDELSLVFSTEQSKLYYAIENAETFNNLLESINADFQKRNDPPGFYDDKVRCVKCTNSECVEDALKAAIGEADEEVIIQVTPNTTLGLKTSVSVCYGTKAAFLNEWRN